MGRLLKIILSIFASIILLVIIAVVVIPLFINPNDFKLEIQAAVKENIGRELIIEGDLELSVFPWIGVSTGKLTLTNAQAFSEHPFAEIKESNVKVKLLPLLSKRLEVSRIVLKGLVLNLAKNKQGINNWDDLSSSEVEDTQSDDATDKDDGQVETENNTLSLAALAIGGVSIEQAKIVWDDQQQGRYTEINDFNLETEKLKFDEPIGIDLSLVVVNKEPELTESLNFSAKLIINEKLDVFNLNSIILDSVTKGKELPAGEVTVSILAELALDLPRQTLDINGFKLNAGNMVLSANINGTHIIDKPVFKGPINIAEFDLAQLMKRFAMPLPVMQGPKALNKLSVTFDLLATADSADIKNLIIKLDDTNVNGSSSIKNFAKPEIKFNIKTDAIDLDRYMVAEKEGKTSASKTIATPATIAAAGATLIPVDTLRGFNANGQLAIDKLTINKLDMHGLNLKLTAKNGLIKTDQSVKRIYQGAYAGQATINVKNRTPMLALNETLTGVQVEPLLKDMQGDARMSGLVNATARIQGRGNTPAAIKSTLHGNINFNFKEGVIRGFNLQQMIDNSKALIKGSSLPKDNKKNQTVFSVIKGTATIKNGLVSNDDLYAEASKLRVKGNGTANLVSEKLDYQVSGKLIKAEATETEPEKLKGIPVIIDIGGTFSKPTYQLDIAAMLTEKNKEKISKKKDELLKKLDEKIGPGVSDLLKGLF